MVRVKSRKNQLKIMKKIWGYG